MGAIRVGPLTALVAVMLLASALAPFIAIAAPPTLPTDTIVRGSLTDTSEREDYNFTANDGEWTIVGVNQYQGEGSFKHGLRTDISSKNPVLYSVVRSTYTPRTAGVIAVNGHMLSSPVEYTISEDRIFGTPSFALQLRQGLQTLSSSSQTITDTLGADGVVMGYEIQLQKRDTIDLRLRVPPEWTYNYNFDLLLFSPNNKFHQFEGEGGMDPVASSTAGENSEQALTYLAMDPGTYCIVILNEATPDPISFSLEVGINGLYLDDGVMDDETLTEVNTDDYYSFIAPSTTWSCVVSKLREDTDFPVTHSLHWPTPDSNTIAYDELKKDSPVGIIAINGRELPSSDTYYARESIDHDDEIIPFTVQFSSPTGTLPASNGVRTGLIGAAGIFTLYEIGLQASQTVDLRLQVGKDYNYDHDLGLYVFPPGEKYYSISGQLPDYADGPAAMSRHGENTEQDVVFTCRETGVYAVVIVNFAERDDIPFTLDVTIQGRALPNDSPVSGDLNAQNSEDLFQFAALRNGWNIVGCRVTSPDGALHHRLHSTALDTNHLIEGDVGWFPGYKGREYYLEPISLLAIDGRELDPGANTTYYVKEEVVEGEPVYIIELENTPSLLAAQSDTLSRNFTAGEFLHTFVLDLNSHESIDLRVSPPDDYTYEYELAIYIFAPGMLYRSFGSEDGEVAMSAPGPNRDPAMVFTAEEAGSYLIVVANLGPISGHRFELRYAVDGFPSSTAGLTRGSLDDTNDRDAIRFNVAAGQWTMVVVRLSDDEPAADLVASIRWPSIDSIPLTIATLNAEEPVAAFLIDYTTETGSERHFVDLQASLPEGRTLSYQIQVETAYSGFPTNTTDLGSEEIGRAFSQAFGNATVDIALRVPPDYTYAYDLGLYLFGSCSCKYLSTNDPETGPIASCRYGPGTEQEIIYTSDPGRTYAVLVLDHSLVSGLSFELVGTMDGAALDDTARGYVDGYNQNEQYNFSAEENQWSVLAAKYLSGGGTFDLKLLTNSLSTNPVVTERVSALAPTGVIAINGWEFEGPKEMFANLSYFEGYSAFVVHAATTSTEFGSIGHTEADAFGEDQIVYIYSIDLRTNDEMEIFMGYDKGNWSSDVILDLIVFEPMHVLGTPPVYTLQLRVIEGNTQRHGIGTFKANKTGTYAFVLVNRNPGPPGTMGFTLGLFRKSIEAQPPRYPAILKATTSTDKITIEWAPNDEVDFDRYEIYLSSSAGSKGRKIDTIETQTASKYTIERLEPGHQYYVTVVVHDTEGLSTASNPYKIKTKDLPIYAEPMVWIIIATIIAAVVAIIGIDWLVKKQRAGAAVAAEKGAEEAVGAPGEAMPEVEGIEAEAERRAPAPDVVEDEDNRKRREAIDYMKNMMGDEK